MKKETVLKRLNEKYGKNFIFYTEKDYNILNGHDNINIICSEHGETKKQVGFLLNKKGNFPCKLCSHNFLSLKFRSNLKEFVNKVKSIHGDFHQEPRTHLSGKGCPKCSHNYKLTKETFIEKAKLIHGDRYTYEFVYYVDWQTKVEITCNIHGPFFQKPNSHLSGHGCHRCTESNGEKLIAGILEKNNINFIREYIIPNQKYKFRYDFYLPDLNVFIEFHGGQHYKPIDFFGGEEGFKDTKRRDIFKKELAKMVKIPIIVFNYKHMRLPKHIYEKYVLKKITNKVNE